MPRNNTATYNCTYIDFDLPLWDPEEALDVGPGRCSGITLRGLPCRQSMFSRGDISSTDKLLEQLCYMDPRKGIPKEYLESLAELTLCPRWHREKRPQGPEVVARWRRALRTQVQSMPPLRRSVSAQRQSNRRLTRPILNLIAWQEAHNPVDDVEEVDSNAESSDNSDNASASDEDSDNESDDSSDPDEDPDNNSDEDSDDNSDDDDAEDDPSDEGRDPANDQSDIEPGDEDNEDTEDNFDAGDNGSDADFDSDSDSDVRPELLTPSATTVTPSTSRTPSPTPHRRSLSGECPICQESFQDPSPTPSTTTTTKSTTTTITNDTTTTTTITTTTTTKSTTTITPTSPQAANSNIVHCRAQCGQNFHAACMREWSAHQQRTAEGPAERRREAVTCPYCRARWQWGEGGEI